MNKALTIFLLSMSLLTACGGGGGDGDSQQTAAQLNQAPSVSIGEDLTFSEGDEVTLNSTVSDSDGDVVSYTWSQSSGVNVTFNSVSEASTSFQAPQVIKTEILELRLTVTDNNGASSFDTVKITVEPLPNLIPTVSAGEDSTYYERETVVLNGVASDEDGSIVLYTWEQVSGVEVILEDKESASSSFLAPETNTSELLEFKLTVTDSDGDINSSTVKITITNFIEPWMFEVQDVWGVAPEDLSTLCEQDKVNCLWEDENLSMTYSKGEAEDDNYYTLTFSITEDRVAEQNIMPSMSLHEERWRGTDFVVESYRYMVWRECKNADCSVDVANRPGMTISEITETGIIGTGNNNSAGMSINGLYNLSYIVTGANVTVDGSSGPSMFVEFYARDFYKNVYNVFKHVYGKAEDDVVKEIPDSETIEYYSEGVLDFKAVKKCESGACSTQRTVLDNGVTFETLAADVNAKWGIPHAELVAACTHENSYCKWENEELHISIIKGELDTDSYYSLTFSLSDSRINEQNLMPLMTLHQERWKGVDFVVDSYRYMVWRECKNADCSVDVANRPGMTISEITETGIIGTGNNNSASMSINGLYNLNYIITGANVTVDGASAPSMFVEFYNKDFFEKVYDVFKYVYN